jgi:hypothetical protein
MEPAVAMEHAVGTWTPGPSKEKWDEFSVEYTSFGGHGNTVKEVMLKLLSNLHVRHVFF